MILAPMTSSQQLAVTIRRLGLEHGTPSAASYYLHNFPRSSPPSLAESGVQEAMFRRGALLARTWASTVFVFDS